MKAVIRANGFSFGARRDVALAVLAEQVARQIERVMENPGDLDETFSAMAIEKKVTGVVNDAGAAPGLFAAEV
jgi:hypothetical protein